MKRYALAAVVYLAVVIGGYSVYDAFLAEDKAPVQEQHTNETHDGSSHQEE